MKTDRIHRDLALIKQYYTEDVSKLHEASQQRELRFVAEVECLNKQIQALRDQNAVAHSQYLEAIRALNRTLAANKASLHEKHASLLAKRKEERKNKSNE